MRNGEIAQEIHIKEGSFVHIPIEGLNFSKDIWGEDALEFKYVIQLSVHRFELLTDLHFVLLRPSRWSSLPLTAQRHPGLANVMTFSCGPHACIGWRFSILEMKIFLATVLPNFNFAPVEGVAIARYNTVVTRPVVKGRRSKGPALPLTVSRYQG